MKLSLSQFCILLYAHTGDTHSVEKFLGSIYIHNTIFSFITGCLPLLSTLQVAHNKLKTADDIKELIHCPSLRYTQPLHAQHYNMTSSLHHNHI